jgi:hypothetical protein
MRACFDAVTVNAARVLGLPGYGLVVGCAADIVLLQARNPVEALRLRATRLLVVRAARCWRARRPPPPAWHCPAGRRRSTGPCRDDPHTPVPCEPCRQGRLARMNFTGPRQPLAT